MKTLGSNRDGGNVSRASRRAGLTLFEIMIALSVIAVAILAMVSLLVSSSRVQEDARERTIAYNSARMLLEELRATPFAEVYRRYNSKTSDDLGSGTNPGSTFTVDRLAPPAGGGPHGRIVFPDDAAGLREDVTNTDVRGVLGLPKDLNRDGDTGDTGLAHDQVYILPVLVEVRWKTVGGKTNLVQAASLIAERE